MSVREPESVDAGSVDTDSVEEMAALFRSLKARRDRRTLASVQGRRRLTVAERNTILAKTGGVCHICGGPIRGVWHADHVAAHSTGGADSVVNLLAAHAICNGYKKRFLPEEMIYVLKLGIWAKTRIETLSPTGRVIGDAFVEHEKSRRTRTRKRSRTAGRSRSDRRVGG